MRNVLTKISYTYTLPGSSAVPASPGRPYIPAHWVTEQQRVCSVVNYDLYDTGQSIEELAQQLLTMGGAGSDLSYNVNYAILCTLQNVTRFVPEQSYIAPTPYRASVPPTVVTEYNLGWTGTARSVDVLLSDGRVSFKADTNNVGAMVGLLEAAFVGRWTALYDYTVMSHNFYIQGRTYAIYEKGVRRTGDTVFASGDVFGIRRKNGTVTYTVNDTTVFTSSAPSTTPVFLLASLYSGGDYVYDPILTAEASGASSMQPLRSAGGEGAYAAAAAYMASLRAVGGGHLIATVSSTMQPVIALASAYGRPYGQAKTRLPALTSDAYTSKVVPPYGLSKGSMAYLTSAAVGTTGGVISGNLTMPKFVSRGSDRVYGEAVVTLPRLSSYANAYEGNENASIISRTITAHEIAGTQIAFAAINMTALGTATLAVATVIDSEAFAQATASGEFDVAQLLEAIAVSSAETYAGVPLWDNAGETIVVNADTSAFSRYEGYGFLAYFHIGDDAYGLSRDGIFLLGGDTDAGLPIQASVHAGAVDAGTSLLKWASECYLAASSDGPLRLRVTVGDNAYVYTARSSSQEMQMQRVDIGKGLRATYFELEVINDNGDDFELDRIEFRSAPTSRRI